MATVLRFEDRSASTTVDLLGTDDIYRLQQNWRQSGAQDGKITEVYRIVVDDTSVANVLGHVQSLEDLLESAFDWHADTLLNESVWLRFAADGETAKRALVYAYDLVPVESGGPLGREMQFDYKVGFDLAVTRHMYWEDVSATQETHATSVSVWGGEWDLTGTISGGRVDSRISEMRVGAPGSTAMDRLWVGIRQPREATANFTAQIDLYSENVVAGNAAQATGETGETGSGHILVDFSADGADMAFRVYWNDTANWDDYVGRYIILCRYKLKNGSSGTVGLRASTGFRTPAYNEPLSLNTTQYVSSTDWDIVELGEVQIPPSGYRGDLVDGISALSTSFVAIEAEQIDGDHDVLLDSIVFLPAEHHIVLEGDVTASLGYWFIFGYEDDEVQGYAARNAPPMTLDERLAVRGADTWQYPHEGGYLVFAGRQASLPHDATDTMGPRIDVYKRWRTYHD